MLYAAFTALWLSVGFAEGGKPDGKMNCDAKCGKTVSTCSDQCVKNFPKAQSVECQKVCEMSRDKCLEKCEGKK